MRSIKLKIVDTNFDSVANLIKWIEEYCDIEWGGEPDYIIHSCFGHEVLKYNGVRIMWLGENLQPDFNISDYAVGFGRMSFGDRYLRVPLYRWYFSDYNSLFDANRMIANVDGSKLLSEKTRFCTMVVSNSGRGNYFDELVNEVNEYKQIASGGRWANNIGGPVEDKMPFLNSGKFHIAFENSSTPGYLTEKLLHAFTAHTIPVYWGDPTVVQDFNPKSFVNCHDFKSIDEVVEYIKYLDKNNDAYTGMLEQPCFVEGKEPDFLKKENIMNFLINIFDQPKEEAYRRNRYYWGKRYQDEQYTAFYRPLKRGAKLIYDAVMKEIRK